MSYFSVPDPCPQPWGAMSPTADGRFCGQCQHEVVDFSALSETEVRARLARPDAGNICGFFRAGQFMAPTSVATPSWPRWPLTGLTLLRLRPPLTSYQTAKLDAAITASAKQPDELTNAPEGQVTIQGWVFDGFTNLAVARAEIFIVGTPYGTVADREGYFAFTMKQEWEPVQNGSVSIRVSGMPFTFKSQTLLVAVSPPPAPLTVRLESQPERGRRMGKVVGHERPQKPPL